jgi:hypothetical protein
LARVASLRIAFIHTYKADIIVLPRLSWEFLMTTKSMFGALHVL